MAPACFDVCKFGQPEPPRGLRDIVAVAAVLQYPPTSADNVYVGDIQQERHFWQTLTTRPKFEKTPSRKGCKRRRRNMASLEGKVVSTPF